MSKCCSIDPKDAPVDRTSKYIWVLALITGFLAGLGAGTAFDSGDDRKVDAPVLDHAAGLPGSAKPGNEIIRYNSNLYAGGSISNPDVMEKITNFGISTVISFAANDPERISARQNGIKLVEFSFKTSAPLPPKIRKHFIDIMRSSDGAVYIHDVPGQVHALILAMVYRIQVKNRSYKDALIEFGRMGGSLKDNSVILDSLKIK